VTSITPSDRAALINGLRALADYLENAPYAPHSADVMLVPIIPEDNARNDHAVVCTDSGIVTLNSAHGSTAGPRTFGPVTYRVTLAPRTGTGQ
jgi:hypothetical protein